MLTVLAVFLSACAKPVTSLSADEDKQLTNESGYLLIGVSTNRNIKSISISGPKNIFLTHKDLKAGTKYILTDLPSGTYTIDKIRYNNFWTDETIDDDAWSFDIQDQKVSYVGNLNIYSEGFYWFTSSHVELINSASEALVFMEEYYPNILSKRELIYGGFGEDDFFQYIGKYNEAK
ncbi:hypothetical protein [Thalassotalea agarivorans]|nr:hypothetical protein [Thalassotalea agarivorans]